MPQSKSSTADQARVNPAAFSLVHLVGSKRKPLFAPTRLMNQVTYIGRLPSNDIVLASQNVSRRHAKLVISDAGVQVHDLDSHNGIFLNGKKVRSTQLNPGDMLYVGDICIEVKRNADADEYLAPNITRISHAEITGEEDSGVRNFATLERGVALSASADPETFPIEAIELCRELTEATVAVLVTRGASGAFETPVVLQPESGRRGDVPVAWNVVKKAFEDALAVFSADARRRPPIPGEALDGAVMCVPVLRDGHAHAAIYLSKPAPSPVFTERELNTVASIAQLWGLREQRGNAAEVQTGGGANDATVVAALAKAEAAEMKLGEAQQDIRTLTERLHALEGDSLKLRQGLEVEKQHALDAKREAERARVEASKLDQGLHKTDEEAKKLKDTIHKLEEERAKLRESVRGLDEERKARTNDVTRLKEAQKALDSERQRLEQETEDLRRQGADAAAQIGRLEHEMQSTRDTAEQTRAALQSDMSALAAQRDALRTALRQTLPPAVAEHVEHSIEGAPLWTEAVPRQVAALHLELFGIDAWAAKASPAEVKDRLDRFCAAVALRAKANGGRVEQVLGHAHLVSFGADPTSVRAALRCGIEVASIMRAEGVVAGLHVGTSVAGFFGEGESATRVEVGEAPALARSLAQLAHAPIFYATDTVQKAVGADPSFLLAMIGPARTQHGTTLLFSVEAAERGGAG